MPKYISMTSGSKSILINIVKQNPQLDLRLYRSRTENTFYLFDWKNKGNVFNVPITYRVIIDSRGFKRGFFINLNYFKLSHKKQRILLAYVKKQLTDGLPINMTGLLLTQNVQDSSQVMLCTTCSSNQAYLEWINNSFMSTFVKGPFNNGFHNSLIKVYKTKRTT